jgi:hypothetical protein
MAVVAVLLRMHIHAICEEFRAAATLDYEHEPVRVGIFSPKRRLKKQHVHSAIF